MTTKLDALLTIASEARNERAASTAAAKRVVRAARALDLTDDEIRQLMAWLDFCDSKTGDPYRENVQRVWP